MRLSIVTFVALLTWNKATNAFSPLLQPTAAFTVRSIADAADVVRQETTLSMVNGDASEVCMRVCVCVCVFVCEYSRIHFR